MKSFWAIAAIGLALATAACKKQDADSSAVPNASAVAVSNTTQAAPYTGRDWTETVSKTSQGGFRMGNPDAAVKLVEYASLTCPHCRDFTRAASEPLRNIYVKTGKVSWEYRNFVLNPLDFAATLVVRCQGADTFFPLVEAAYSTQEKWVGQFNAIDEKKLQTMGTLPQAEQFKQLVALTGLGDFFKSHGVPEDKINACLADKKGLDNLLKLRDYGVNTDKVDGTPNFILNGERLANVYDWPGLEAKLKEKVR
jgi:protein-disulfide isomerase